MLPLAFSDLLQHISDNPWPGWQVEVAGMTVTLMSSAIATMLLVAITLMVVLPILARRWRTVPHGGANALEVVVVFVRDMIAKPALKDRAYTFLPFLLTMFVFILAMNMAGLVPLEQIAHIIGAHTGVEVHIGGAPTSVMTLCGGLAAATLMMIVLTGLQRTAERWRERKGWPWPVCIALSPLLWLVGLSPAVPGRVGAVLRVPLSLLEFVGAVGKCGALVIRLFANMMSGHVLLGVLLLFVFQAGAAWVETGSKHVLHVAPAVVAASVLVSILELVVAGLQAYIFTFLAAMFLGLYAEGQH